MSPIQADFTSSELTCSTHSLVRQQLQALNEEKEKFVQREFDQRVMVWDEARRKRDFINSEQRRKMIDEKRRKDELKDDSKDLERVGKEVRRIKEEKDISGTERTEREIAAEDQVSSHDWKRPYPAHLYKAFDLITALAKEYPLPITHTESTFINHVFPV